MFCNNCGKELKNEWIKCPYCGTETGNIGEENTAEGVFEEKGADAGMQSYETEEAGSEWNDVPHSEKISHRKFWKFLLLSIVTCGIYGIYVLCGYVKDINKVCDGDGKESKNYIVVLLLSIVTCGIYGVYWWYTQGERLYNAAPSYGIKVREKGSTILIWILLGCTLMPGVGLLVAAYIMFDNMNRIASAYNGEMSAEDIRKMGEPHPHLIRNAALIYIVLLVILIGSGTMILGSLFSYGLSEENVDLSEEYEDYSDRDFEELIGWPKESLEESDMIFEENDFGYQLFDGDVQVMCGDEKADTIIISGEPERKPVFHGVKLGMGIDEAETLLKDAYMDDGVVDNKKTYINPNTGSAVRLTVDNDHVKEIIATQLTEEEIKEFVDLKNQEETDAEAEQKDMSEEYIFPDSNKRYLTEEEVLSMDAATLKIARNEIFARYGYIFKSEDLKAHFKGTSWYREKVKAEKFDADKTFNKFEKKNIELLKRAEEKLNGKSSEDQRQSDNDDGSELLEDLYPGCIEVSADELARNPSDYDGENIIVEGSLFKYSNADYQIGGFTTILVFVENGVYDKNGEPVEYAADGDWGYIIGTFHSFGYESYGEDVHGIDNAMVMLNE